MMLDSLKKKHFKKDAPRLKSGNNISVKGYALLYIYIILLIWFLDPNLAFKQINEDVDSWSKKSEIVIKKIEVNGNSRLSDKSIIKLTGLQTGVLTLRTDINEIKNKLENDSRIESVIVRRILPSKIIIEVEEKAPVSLWWDNGNKYLMDIEGDIIEKIYGSLDKYQDFIVVFCEKKYRNHYKDIFFLIKNSELSDKVVSIENVSGRRWNIYLKNKIKVMLPEAGIKKALDIYNTMLKKNVIRKKTSVVDLRLVPQKVYIS